MTQDRKIPKPLVVVYHADCIDGAACAWSVAKAWGQDDPRDQKNSNITYIPYAHHDFEDAEDKIRAALREDAAVYFVDVAPTSAFLDELMTPDDKGTAKAQKIHIMDHHVSAADMLDGYQPPAAPNGTTAPQLHIKIDKTRTAAAAMVWEEIMPGKPVPDVLHVINKMDGNAAGLTTPQDFFAAALVDTFDITTVEKSFHTLRNLARMTFNDMARRGRHIAHDQDTKIERLLEAANIIPLQILPNTAPIPVPIVNGDVKQYGRKISDKLVELGQKTGSDIAFAWYMQKNGTVSMSIRTNGNPDAAKVAEHLRNTMGVTGGGHAGAGAVHFSSLFEFARHMPFDYAAPTAGTQAQAQPPTPNRPPKDKPGQRLH
jgi:nanoRNase/pAp phosphatase (c-di-AMP/oligoRNAs hydrolase)